MESLNQTLDHLLAQQAGNESYQQLMTEVFADPEVQAFLQAHQSELSAQSIQRGRAKLYEYVHERNLANQGRVSVAPGYVPKLVVSAGQIDVAYVPTDQLKAQRAKAARLARVTPISMPKFIRQASFDAFFREGPNATPSRNQALERALMFVKQYSPNRFVPGLYLSGSFGVGKTYLLGAIANQLADQGVQTTLVHFPSFDV